MDRKSFSVSLVSGTGSLVGVLGGMQFASRLGLPEVASGTLGMLVGGLSAYIIVDFQNVLTGVTRAWNEVINWEPYVPYWKAFFAVGLASSSIVFYAACALWSLVLYHFSIKNFREVLVLGEMSLLFTSTMFFVSGYVICQTMPRMNKFGRLRDLVNIERKSWRFLKWANPFGALYSLVWLVGNVMLGTIRLGKITYDNSPAMASAAMNFSREAVKKSGLFLKTAFIYIHSERRLICFTSAALGCGIGFFGFHHNAIVGFVVGALAGLIDYEVVSVRLLKVGSKSR